MLSHIIKLMQLKNPVDLYLLSGRSAKHFVRNRSILVNKRPAKFTWDAFLFKCLSIFGGFIYLSLREVILQKRSKIYMNSTLRNWTKLNTVLPVRFISFEIKYTGRLDFSGFSNFVPENLFFRGHQVRSSEKSSGAGK